MIGGRIGTWFLVLSLCLDNVDIGNGSQLNIVAITCVFNFVNYNYSKYYKKWNDTSDPLSVPVLLHGSRHRNYRENYTGGFLILRKQEIFIVSLCFVSYIGWVLYDGGSEVFRSLYLTLMYLVFMSTQQLLVANSKWVIYNYSICIISNPDGMPHTQW